MLQSNSAIRQELLFQKTEVEAAQHSLAEAVSTRSKALQVSWHHTIDTHRHAIDTGMHHTHLDCFIALCSQSCLWEVSCHIPFAHGSRRLHKNANIADCKVDTSFVLQNAERMQKLVFTLQRNLTVVEEAKTEAVMVSLYRILL